MRTYTYITYTYTNALSTQPNFSQAASAAKASTAATTRPSVLSTNSTKFTKAAKKPAQKANDEPEGLYPRTYIL